FCWPLRVYYEDTDAGGIVFYANYLKFFERARTEWLRAAGVGQQQLSSETRCMFVVKSASIDYHAPARLDDRLEISVRIQKLGRASVLFTQEAWRMNDQDSVRLCTGSIRVGCVDTNSLRPAEIPVAVFKKISDANHPMLAARI
ncbi:MAG: tol-pal system-associated acyl-CoA thioesterase, partial [Betaproteobacteria bacterium]|nr:tol-pal system-associated acyl-CoA thioesterase [Betaproteobacteria bacterium]